MSYLVYLVSTDESATVLVDPMFTFDEIPTEITDEQVFSLVVELLERNDLSLPADIKTGSDALQWMREEAVYYSEDLLVVVPDDGKIKDKLFAVGEALLDTMQDDSSCYHAAEVWCSVVRSHGVAQFGI